MTPVPACMGFNPPKETGPKCGCRPTGPHEAYATGMMVAFCPMHAAASDLREALEETLRPSDMRVCAQRARGLLRKLAEPKP